MLCTSTGIPMPTLTWLKDESPVDTNLVSVISPKMKNLMFKL